MRFIKYGFIFSLVTIPSLAHAGAWTAKEGESYHKLSVNIFDTNERFGDELPDFENFRDYNVTYYGEIGLQDDLTFFASVPFKDLQNTSAGITTNNSGIGDVDVGLRYRLANGPFIVSLQGLVKAPIFYDEDDELPLGNGQTDLEGRLLVGRSLGKAGYFGLEAGYRFRAQEPVDEFRYLVEYGVDLSSELYVRAKLDGTIALGSASIATESANPGNPSLPLAFDLGKLETTAGYKFSDSFAAEFTATQSLYGDNTLRGTNFQFAIVAQF